MTRRATLVGVNHLVLEVGDLDAALVLYERLFAFELRGRVPGMAFIDMGDQFVVLAEGRTQEADGERHFGLVVDDVEAARAAIEREKLEIVPSRGVDFRDPWGNHVQVVAYADVQFERTEGVKRKLGIEGLEKSEDARAEIRDRGLE